MPPHHTQCGNHSILLSLFFHKSSVKSTFSRFVSENVNFTKIFAKKQMTVKLCNFHSVITASACYSEEDQNIDWIYTSYRHQVIEVGISWRPHFECVGTDIVESLVVETECQVAILHKLMAGQYGIVWFHDHIWNLKIWNWLDMLVILIQDSSMAPPTLVPIFCKIASKLAYLWWRKNTEST